MRGLVSATLRSCFGQELNPGTPPGASGSQSYSRKPKANAGRCMPAGTVAAICIDCDTDAPMIMPMEGSSGASVSPIDPRCGIPTAEAIRAAASNPPRGKRSAASEPAIRSAGRRAAWPQVYRHTLATPVCECGSPSARIEVAGHARGTNEGSRFTCRKTSSAAFSVIGDCRSRGGPAWRLPYGHLKIGFILNRPALQ